MAPVVIDLRCECGGDTFRTCQGGAVTRFWYARCLHWVGTLHRVEG